MSNRKNQNSILVIATLGVYLGLVLAGATPQVLAHAATSRQFDIRDEIERRDDLDNKPDDERSPVTASVQIYLEDVEYFLSNLGRLRSKGQFDAGKDTFNVVQTTLLPCVDSNRTGRYTPLKFETTSEHSKSALEIFSRGLTYGYSLGDCVPNFAFDGVSVIDSRFDFRLDHGDLTVNLAVKKQNSQRAIDLQHELDSTLALYAKTGVSQSRTTITQNTAFRTENDQVFVILRLPRGSLDPLLAIDAK